MDFRFEFDDLPDPITPEERTSYIERMHVEYDSFLLSLANSKEYDGLLKYRNMWSDLEELHNKKLSSKEVDHLITTNIIQEARIVPNPKGAVRKTLTELRDESIYDDFEDFRIYRGSIPYSGYYDRYKEKRPWIAFKVSWGNEYIFIPIHSTYDRTPMSYDIDILDWEEAGLDHESRALVRDIGKVKYTSAVIRNDFLSNRDIVRIRKMFDKMIDNRFKEPEAFFSWVINNEIKYESINNNLNKPIRTLNKVKHEKAIDCLELAIITYKMCINCKEISNSGIGFGIWVDKKNHKHIRFFTIFKVNNQYWTIQYLQTRKGYIERHRAGSLSSFVKIENKLLNEGYYHYPEFCGKRKLIKQGLLSPIELRIIAEDTSDFKTHRELLNFLDLKNRKGL